jgi:hypothetical protein
VLDLPNSITRWLTFARVIIDTLRSEGTASLEEAGNLIPILLTNSRSPKRGNEHASAGKMLNGDRSRVLSSYWRDNIAFLNLTSFVGAIPGASHWYATLCFNKERNEVAHELSQREAALMNKSDGKNADDGFIWSPGDIASRYRSKEDAVRVAKEKWREIAPEAKALMLGDIYVGEPQPIIAGLPVEIMEELNALFNKCESLGWWDEGNDAEVEKIYEEWKVRIEEELNVDAMP